MQICNLNCPNEGLYSVDGHFWADDIQIKLASKSNQIPISYNINIIYLLYICYLLYLSILL